MVSAIASRKYERAALSRLFRFTLAIQPTVQANTEVTAEVTMWPTRCSRPWAFSLTGNLTLSLGMFAETDNEGNVSGRRITVSKLRDGQTRWGCDFTLVPHEMGTDDEGIEIMSAYVEDDATLGTYHHPLALWASKSQ